MTADGQTVNRIQILRNDLFGEIEILQTHSQTFIAKRLTAKSAATFERAHKAFPFLFSNEFPFLQEFQAQTELFGRTYLLFKYHDYSLQNLLDANRRAGVFLPENMLLKLLNDLLFVLHFFKSRGLAYPLVHHKTVFLSKTGNLKFTNPLLFEESFINLDRVTDEAQGLLATDARIGEAAKLVLEQATFATLFGPEATPTDFAAALRGLQPRYSFDFFNLIRKFDYVSGARVPIESNFQNVNVAENFFKADSSNIDKYLAGVRVAPVDLEVRKSPSAKAYTIQNRVVSNLPDVRAGIFDSQATGGRPPGGVSPRRMVLQTTSDIPVEAAKRIFDTPASPVGVVNVSGKTDPHGGYGNTLSYNNSAVSAQAYAQGHPQNETIRTDFGKKKNNDSFFEEVFERQLGSIANGIPPRVSIASQESLMAVQKQFATQGPQSLPVIPQAQQTCFSGASDDFFNIPASFRAQPNPLTNPPTNHNVSASFRADPFYNPQHDLSGSEYRRSHPNNQVEGRVLSFGVPEPRVRAPSGSAIVDPNESFSKRLAQFYQQEYQERNDSIRESATNHHARGSGSSGPQQPEPLRLKPGDKAYAVIHDFPVNS